MAVSDDAALPPPSLTPAPKVLVVVSPYYREIADGLWTGASAVLGAAGAAVERLDMPGALEIPTAIGFAAEAGAFDGYVALGCVIRGETSHYDLVCGESARGLTQLGVSRGLCIGNGILTVETLAQAQERAAPDRLDKGGGAAAACLHLIAAARRFRARPRGFPSTDEQVLMA